ncbi:MAG: EI24 domain-containing protein, partial [Pseudomonadota bacterium]|nr:EI24 domain-containing protein [Pseudomonadota bacterium]
MLIRAFTLAFGQLSDKRLRKILSLSLIITSAILGFLFLGFGLIIYTQEVFEFSGLLFPLNYVVNWVFDLFGTMILFVLGWYFFPALASVTISFFLEDIAEAAERRHYPNLTMPRKQSIGELLIVTCKFLVIAIFLNLIVLPIYLVLFFLGPLNLFVFYLINGYLIGREYFEIIAHRRLGPEEAKTLRKENRWKLLFAGMFITFMMTIPFVNLAAPVIGTLAMVHLVGYWNSGNANIQGVLRD